MDCVLPAIFSFENSDTQASRFVATRNTPAVSPLPSKVNRCRPSSRVYSGFRHVSPRGCAVKNVAEKNTAPVRLRFAVWLQGQNCDRRDAWPSCTEGAFFIAAASAECKTSAYLTKGWIRTGSSQRTGCFQLSPPAYSAALLPSVFRLVSVLIPKCRLSACDWRYFTL